MVISRYVGLAALTVGFWCLTSPLEAQEKASDQDLVAASITLGRVLYKAVDSNDVESAQTLINAYRVLSAEIADDVLRKSIDRTTTYVNAAAAKLAAASPPRKFGNSLVSGGRGVGTSYLTNPDDPRFFPWAQRLPDPSPFNPQTLEFFRQNPLLYQMWLQQQYIKQLQEQQQPVGPTVR